MSRRPSRHAANKAKLAVSKKHDDQCKRIFNAFVDFCDEPWASDDITLAQLKSARTGPVFCYPTDLLLTNPSLLSIFIAAFIVTFRISDYYLKRQYGDRYVDICGKYIDMRKCTDPNLFLAKGTFKGYVASLNAAINRSVYEYVSDWKKDHIADICNGMKIPYWADNPPQIDIETDGKWSDVKRVYDELYKKCHDKKGMNVCIYTLFFFAVGLLTLFFISVANIK